MLTANDLVVPAGVDVNLDIESNDVIHSFWIPALNGKKDAVPGRIHELRINADSPAPTWASAPSSAACPTGMRQRVIALPQDEFDEWLAGQEDDARVPAEEEAAAGAELFTTQCSGCHLARGINDEEFEEGSGEELLVAGNAPTSRASPAGVVFAGGIFDSWLDGDGDEIVEADEIGGDGELNSAALEAWLRNPPGEKPMDAPYVPEPGDRRLRGMPNFNLQEAQIDQLVAFCGHAGLGATWRSSNARQLPSSSPPASRSSAGRWAASPARRPRRVGRAG